MVSVDNAVPVMTKKAPEINKAFNHATLVWQIEGEEVIYTEIGFWPFLPPFVSFFPLS